MKSFLISGTSSGVGKTTITLAIAAALRRRGLVVQPYKCGPDYLDTSHHTVICGRPCRNLDTIMLPPEENHAVLAATSTGADVLLAEGMMGLYDGLSGESDHGSSAEISKLLNLPVILVLDASSASRSVAAMLLGFCNFDPAVRIAGVVLNRVSGEAHFKMLAEAIKQCTATPILGWVPKNKAWKVPERHLGLQDAGEGVWNAQRIDELAAFAENNLDLDLLLSLAQEVAPREPATAVKTPSINAQAKKVRIGIARDEAFSFYYADNFDLLEEAGAELVFFSPLHDARLPEDLDGIYFGGGYPELHAAALVANRTMTEAVRGFAEAGHAIYAECGGMIYMGESLKVQDDTYAMTGILPLSVAMSPRLVKFGYVRATLRRDSILGKAGTQAIGHSFHYSLINSTGNAETAYQLEYIRAARVEDEGFIYKNVLGSYVHLHFRSNRALAENFVRAAASPGREE